MSKIIGKDNQYELKQRLGQGSYAYVYRGIEIATKKVVAIKHMKKLKKQIIEAVQKEIKIMKSLDHKNIVKYFTDFQDGAEWYIVMEYCGKGDLQQFKNKRVGKIPQYHCKLFVKCILQGLIYLHQKNIAHRDLKLSNILIDNDYQLKLADFGFSKDNQNGMMQTFCGTPLLMAPQILNRSSYTLKCDVWALGVLTYMMLYNKPPFLPQLKQLKPGVDIFGLKRAVNRNEIKFDQQIKISEDGLNFMSVCLEKSQIIRPTTKQLKNHPWMKREINLGSTTVDRRSAIAESLNQKDQSQNLCKLLFFGVFETHIEKLSQILMISQQLIGNMLSSLTRLYSDHQKIKYYILQLVRKKIQSLQNRQITFVIHSHFSYKIQMKKTLKFQSFLKNIKSFVTNKQSEIAFKPQQNIKYQKQILLFIYNQTANLIKFTQQQNEYKMQLLKDICKLLNSDYTNSQIFIRWGNNPKYQNVQQKTIQLLIKYNSQKVIQTINQQITDNDDLQQIWLIENQIDKCFRTGKEQCERKMIWQILNIPSNFTADKNDKFEQTLTTEFQINQ